MITVYVNIVKTIVTFLIHIALIQKQNALFVLKYFLSFHAVLGDTGVILCVTCYKNDRSLHRQKSVDSMADPPEH